MKKIIIFITLLTQVFGIDKIAYLHKYGINLEVKSKNGWYHIYADKLSYLYRILVLIML